MRVVKLRIHCLTFFLLVTFYPVSGSSYNDIRFNRLTINDGLSLSSVYCIYQDSKGFMWFGTEDGLNKYDGKSFIIYRADDERGLAYKWTELIFEDRQGILWFGSRGGLTRFDPARESFTLYKTSYPEPFRLTNDTITSIYQISDKYMLVGTIAGLDRINLESLECAPVDLPDEITKEKVINIISTDRMHYLIAGPKGVLLVNNSTKAVSRIGLPEGTEVTDLVADENRLWIGTKEGVFMGIVSRDLSGGKIEAHRLNETKSLEVEQMLPADTSTLYISTPIGLYKTDFSAGISKFIPSRKSTHSLAIVAGKSLLRDYDGNIWYATHGDGLYRIERHTGRISNYSNNSCDPGSISENAINCIYQDRSGTLWFGTFGAGISYYNPYVQRFDLLRSDPQKDNTLASNFIWSILEDRQGRIWIGTNDKGISLYSPAEGTYTQFDHKAGDPSTLSNSSVRELFEDSEGTVWVGTDGGGLDRYNEKSNSFSHFISDPEDPNTITGNSVRVIYEDRQGSLWIGTRSGLNRFDRNTGRFIRYQHDPYDPESLSNNFIYSGIYQDLQNNLWIGTYGGGLEKLDIRTGKFTHYRNDPANPNSISDNIVFSIVEDKHGILWVGTNSGLDRFDSSAGTFSRFGIEQGLPNEVIYGVLPDHTGNLWLSTNLGICRFNFRDSSTVNYDVTQGLQSNEFNGGAFHRGHSGKLYFGGVYGLNIIDPGLIGRQKDHSKIVFTRLEILGKDVKVRSMKNKKNGNRVIHDSLDYYLPVNIAYASELILDYSIRYFSLEFIDLGNMNYTNIRYAYFMEGLDNNWHNSGDRNFVSYANMPPGKYSFRVRSQQPGGEWSNSVAEISLTITPPFWKTWWFRMLEIIVILAVVFSVYRFLVRLRTYRILKVQNERINNANRKLKESEQNLKLMNATKDKFFSIISHDLKNPFTSLLSISETMSKNYVSYEEEEKKMGVQKIHSAIQHIYNLLENLLTWSRTQTGKIQFNPAEFNLSELITQNYNLYQLAAGKKKVELRSHVKEGIKVFADLNMIDAIIRNLLNNALKFTPSGKTVEIGITDQGDYWEVYIKDEGVGISAENLQKLFRIDEKVKTTGTEGEKGTGLGLIICKEFVEKNNGQIKVTSQVGEGSTFSFTLPK